MASDWKVLVGYGLAAGLGIGIFSAGAYYLGLRRGRFLPKPVGKSYEEIHDPLAQYTIAHNQEDHVLAELRRISIDHTKGRMTSSVETGKLLTLLCQCIGARKVLDIGTFTGCSAYSMALGLLAGGRIISCDVSSDYAEIGRPYWNEGGVSDKIDLRIQPALTTLQELIDNGESETFDMIFIDALKTEYPQYFSKGVLLLRPGGIFVVDNALWNGKVADPSVVGDPSTEAIRQINCQMRDDERVEFVLLNLADGIGMAVKK